MLQRVLQINRKAQSREERAGQGLRMLQLFSEANSWFAMWTASKFRFLQKYELRFLL